MEGKLDYPSSGRFHGSLVGALVGDAIGAHFEGRDALTRADVEAYVMKHVVPDRPLLRYTDDTAMTTYLCVSLRVSGAVRPTDLAARFVAGYFSDLDSVVDRGYGHSTANLMYALRRRLVEDGVLGGGAEIWEDLGEGAKPTKDIDGGGLAWNESLAHPAEIIGNCEWERPAREQFSGAGNVGNGAAMRSAPIGLFHCLDDWQSLCQSVDLSARVTHTNKDAVNGAILVATAVALAINSSHESRSSGFHVLLDGLANCAEQLEAPTSSGAQVTSSSVRPRSPSGRPRFNFKGLNRSLEVVEKPYCSALREVRRLLEADEVDPVQAAIVLGNDTVALRSVPLAIFAFLHGIKLGNFPETVLFAISCGGDTDTIASMAGAMAGAYWGINGVPDVWRQCCEDIEVAIENAQWLAERVHLRAAQTADAHLFPEATGVEGARPS